MKDFVLGDSPKLEDFLSEPIPLGAYGTCTAPQAGKLYVRCEEPLAKISDNSGSLKLKLKKAGEGPALPQPKK